MTRNKIIAFIAGALALFGGAGIAFANPFYFGPTVQTSVATSTPVYMTPGNATTTLVYNSSTDSTNPTAVSTKTNAVKADSVTFLFALTGSSTVSVANVTFEFSNDGIDWYQNELPIFGYSTTSQTFVPTTPLSMNLQFASTTVGGAAGTSAVDRIAVTVPVPTKDVRAVVTLKGANAAVWQQFVPIKQNN